MNQEITRILKALEGNINGKPWFGNNLFQQLDGIDSNLATIVPEKLNHSIAEIIHHMMAWRKFVIEKLIGNEAYEVWETDLDWVKIPSHNESEWQNLLAALVENQELLMQTISDKAEELLETKVESRNYNFRLMLNGIIQHDIYHIGQISIVRKLVL
ncbi:MAG: DinB family protein [Bacteroidota bacterium]